MARLSRPAAATTVACLGLAILASSVQPAGALDEAQVVSASCTAVRVRQAGVPAGTAVELVAVDAARGGDLGSVRAVADAGGVVDAIVPADLRRVARVVVEVERTSDKAEIGEAATDLPQPCSRRAAPAPALTSAPSASAAAARASARASSIESAAADQPARSTPVDAVEIAGWSLIGAGTAVLLAAGFLALTGPRLASGGST